MNVHAVSCARAARSRLVDVVLIVVAGALGYVAVTTLPYPAGWPTWARTVELLVGLPACLTLWWRLSHPVIVASITVVAGALLSSVSAAPLFALYSVASVCSWRLTVLFFAVNAVSIAGPLILRPEIDTPPLLLLSIHIVGVVAATALGVVIRSRRELLQSLRERAVAAETEAALRASHAEHQARDELAREMHDVLGHRLSLLSIHAGALGYNAEMSVSETARVIEEIRRNAHEALQDLREVLHVLRSPRKDVPMPTAVDIPALLHEVRRGGTPITFSDDDGLTRSESTVPALVGRTLYRFVQEGLTNVRKHAPGAEAQVTFTGVEGEGIIAEIHNAAATGDTFPDGAASGSGLRGLAERAALVGGNIERGPTTDGGWRLLLRLPWPV